MRWTIVLAAVMIGQQACAQKGGNMDFADKDWVSVITEGGNAVVLARVEKVKREWQVSEQETGRILEMHMVRKLGGVSIPEITNFEAGSLQLKQEYQRIKSGSQGWNGVTIQPGKTVVLAAPASAWKPGAVIEPVAVAEVSPDNDPLVQGIERSFAIEKEHDRNQQKRLYAQAIRSDLPVLGSYAQFCISRLKKIPRAEAVELDAALAADHSAPLTNRLSAASAMNVSLWANGAPADAENKKILSALFVLMGDPHPDAQRSTAASLHRVLIAQSPGEGAAGRDYRTQLLSGVGQPGPDAIRNLQAMTADPSVGKEAAAVLTALSGR